MQDETLGQLIRAKARISDPANHLRNDYHRDGRMCSFYALALEVCTSEAGVSVIHWHAPTSESAALRVLADAADTHWCDPAIAVCHANNGLSHSDLMAVWDKAIAARAAAVGEPLPV